MTTLEKRRANAKIQAHKAAELFKKHGTIAGVAREMGRNVSTVQHWLNAINFDRKPYTKYNRSQIQIDAKRIPYNQHHVSRDAGWHQDMARDKRLERVYRPLWNDLITAPSFMSRALVNYEKAQA